MGDSEQTAQTPLSEGEAYTEMPVDEPVPDAPPTMGQKLMAKKLYLIIGVVGVAVLVVAAAVLGGGAGAGLFNKPKIPVTIKLVEMTGAPVDIKGAQVKTGTTFEQPLTFGGGGNDSKNSTGEVTNLMEVTVACSWTDDYSGSDPDTMKFELTGPGNLTANQTTDGTSGNCKLTLKTNTTEKRIDDNTAGWVLKVTCVKAGGKKVGPIGLLIYVDAGNDWAAKVDYKYYGKGK